MPQLNIVFYRRSSVWARERRNIVWDHPGVVAVGRKQWSLGMWSTAKRVFITQTRITAASPNLIRQASALAHQHKSTASNT